MMNKPVSFCYPHKPIASLEKLAICLGITLEELLYLRQYSDSFYFLHEHKAKPDGTFRDTYNVRDRLKIFQNIGLPRIFARRNSKTQQYN